MWKTIALVAMMMLSGCQNGHLTCYSAGTKIYDGQVKWYTCSQGSCSWIDENGAQESTASCVMQR